MSQSEFDKYALFAPFGGMLLDGHKIAGELVMPGEKVYEIIDLSSLKIFGYINENEILDISLENKVEVTIPMKKLMAQLTTFLLFRIRRLKLLKLLLKLKIKILGIKMDYHQ